MASHINPLSSALVLSPIDGSPYSSTYCDSQRLTRFLGRSFVRQLLHRSRARVTDILRFSGGTRWDPDIDQWLADQEPELGKIALAWFFAHA